MKKVLSMLLVVVMVMSLLPAVVISTADEESDFYYYENDDGITITGYYGSDTEIEIPSEIDGKAVTSIGAFSGCSSLTSIEIPYSVTSIGGWAFSNCSGLTSITIPDSVTSIGEGAFYGTAYYNDENNWEYGVLYIGKYLIEANSSAISGDYIIKDGTKLIADAAFSDCSSLTSIEIPDGVTSIGVGAFFGCTSLASIEIPDSVTSIGSYAFYSCNSLTSIVIPDGVTSIGSYAFYNCSSLTSIVIPDGVTSIEERTFKDCTSLASIVIPDSVTSIGDYAFASCSSLESIVIPGSVTYIGWSVFELCENLTSIVIPDSVTSIGDNAFSGTEYYKNESNWEDGVLYIGKYLIKANSEVISGDYRIKDGTKIIADSAFYDCSSLTSIVIPDGVTSIGLQAFYYCSSLTSIVIPNSVTSIGWGAFFDCSGLTSIEISDSVTSIVECVFENCSSLTSIVIPDSVTSIGYGAFQDCSSLTSIEIPYSVTDIGYYAFSGCSNLTSIVFPSSVTDIGEGVISGCYNLTSIIFPDNITSISSYSGISDTAYYKDENNWEDGAFYIGNCLIRVDPSVSGTFVVKDGTKVIGPNAFSGERVYDYSETPIGKFVGYSGFEKLEKIEMPDSVTTIEGSYYGDSAIMCCSGLKSVRFSDNITEFPGFLFTGCDSLEEFNIPKSMTTISSEAFHEADFKKVTVPEWIKAIEFNAFLCSLEEITILSRDVVFDEGAFFENNITFYGYAGSTTETFVNEQNEKFEEYGIEERYTFVALSEDEPEPIDPEPNGHDWDEGKITTPATCEKDGVKTYTCKNDPTHTKTEVIKATGHDWGEWTVTTAATEEKEGVETRVCKNDKTHVETRTIPKLEPAKVEYKTDEGTVMVDSGAFEEGTTVKVELITDAASVPEFKEKVEALKEVSEDFVIFEFNAEKDGAKVQPNGKVKVTIDMPKSLSPDNLKMYYVSDDGKLEEIPITVDKETGTIIAELEHFSTYALVNVEPAADPATNAQTGDSTALILFTALISLAALAGATVFGKRKLMK